MEKFWSGLEAYVRAYLPHWQYQREGSEPEAALMTVLGEMLARSREELLAMPRQRRQQYLNAWNREFREAEPMYAYAAFAAPAEMRLPAGSVFYRGGDGARLWETAEDTWACAGRLVMQAVTSGTRGKFIPLPLPSARAPVKLFDFDRPGEQSQQARFQHPAAFSSPYGCRASLGLRPFPEELLRFFRDPGACRWYLETDGREQPLDPPRKRGKACRLRCRRPVRAVRCWSVWPTGSIPPRRRWRRPSRGRPAAPHSRRGR